MTDGSKMTLEELTEFYNKIQAQKSVTNKANIQRVINKRRTDDDFRIKMNETSAKIQARRYHEDEDYRERKKERCREAMRKRRAAMKIVESDT